MSEEIKEQCKVVAENFQWWATTANKYLEQDDWTEGKIKFVQERFKLYERVNEGLQKQDFSFTIPMSVKTSPSKWYVSLSVAVTGYRCMEHVHLLVTDANNSLLLYRTKDKARALEHNTHVVGNVWVRPEKVLFAGQQFPVAQKVSLK